MLLQFRKYVKGRFLVTCEYNNSVNKICPTCFYQGKSKFRYTDNFRIPIAGLLLGLGLSWILTADYSSEFISDPYSLIILLPIIIFMIVGIIFYEYYKKNSKLCSKCGYGYMININTKKAEDIISQSNMKD